MLHKRDFGYATMTRDLKAYSIDDISLETCKRYCSDRHVVIERIPKQCGFSITLRWHRFRKPFDFRLSYKNILWLHWTILKEYIHINGEVVYDPLKKI